LDKKNFGKVVRKLWPLYFRSLLLTSCGSLIPYAYLYITADALEYNNYHFAIMAGTATLSGICEVIIPQTNAATDRGDKLAFDRLHAVSVGSTVIMLIGNIAFLFL
jgi:hypothetical protein